MHTAMNYSEQPFGGMHLAVQHAQHSYPCFPRNRYTITLIPSIMSESIVAMGKTCYARSLPYNKSQKPSTHTDFVSNAMLTTNILRIKALFYSLFHWSCSSARCAFNLVTLFPKFFLHRQQTRSTVCQGPEPSCRIGSSFGKGNFSKGTKKDVWKLL